MVEGSDRQLIERFQRGEPSAFEALFTRHYARVYRAAFGVAQDVDAADDLAQEAFLALYRQPPTLAQDGSLAAWLCRVALNRGINALRGARREQARLARLGPEEAVHPDDQVLRDEERAQVRLALAHLEERQARLLALRYAGLSYIEIAQALGVAPGSVGTLLARAERAFLAAYTTLEPDPHPSG